MSATASEAPILAPMNRVSDVEAAGDFEKKHTPYIELEQYEGKTRVRVKVGHYFPHPNEPGHFITWISLSVGEAEIARFDLSPVVTEPDVCVVVNVERGAKLTAIEHCNLHGLWVAEMTA